MFQGLVLGYLVAVEAQINVHAVLAETRSIETDIANAFWQF